MTLPRMGTVEWTVEIAAIMFAIGPTLIILSRNSTFHACPWSNVALASAGSSAALSSWTGFGDSGAFLFPTAVRGLIPLLHEWITEALVARLTARPGSLLPTARRPGPAGRLLV